MTKEMLLNCMNNIAKMKNKIGYHRMNTCKAYILNNYAGYTVLISYDTPCAIYSEKSHTLYALRNPSQTTEIHISKFAYIMKPKRVVYMYQRTDRIVEKDMVTGYHLKMSKWEYWLEETEDKWESYIYE